MNMEIPGRVSIVISLYNQKHYIAKTLDSAVAQSYEDVEIIVVDDGSTDEPISVLSEYPIQIIKQANQGLPTARNVGIEQATGEFIVILDSDDILDENYITKTLPLMKDGVAAVATDFSFFGRDTGHTILKKPTLPKELDSNEMTCTALFRRKALLAVGGYKPEMVHGYEDWEMWINLLKHGWEIEVLNECLFHYRIKYGYAESMRVRATIVHKELLAIVHRIHADLYQKYAKELRAKPKNGLVIDWWDTHKR